MSPLQGISHRGGRAILAPRRAGRAKIKKGHKVCSCGVQDLSNEPLPIALPALPADRLRKLPSLLYDTLSKISMKNLFLFELHPISSTFFQERLEKCLKMGGTV